jgi:hypothetical protein
VLPSKEPRAQEPQPSETQPQPRSTRSLGTRPLTLPPKYLPQDTAPSLDHLPVEIQEFVAKPINAPYLQMAMSLSQIPAEILRQFASGLFEITY